MTYQNNEVFVDQESWLRGLGACVGKESVVYDAWAPPKMNLTAPLPGPALDTAFTRQNPMRQDYHKARLSGPAPPTKVAINDNVLAKMAVPSRMSYRSPGVHSLQ